MSSNLPPGVNANMLPGNTPGDAEWEQFEEWALEQLMTLDIDTARRAVAIGIAGAQAEQSLINKMLKEARDDERLANSGTYIP